MIPQLLYLLGLLLLAVLALRSVRAASAPTRSNVVPGTETGTLEAYFARIEALAAEGKGGYFVTAKEADGPRFIQVAAGRDREGLLRFRFDLPVTDWSRAYAVRVEAEARHRGLEPYRNPDDGMTFLDIDFPTSGDHAVFARWVVADVFGLPTTTRFEITWG
ncbi:MAG: hypothetical protein AAF222_05665 [Pseudomonadota bacterium]